MILESIAFYSNNIFWRFYIILQTKDKGKPDRPITRQPLSWRQASTHGNRYAVFIQEGVWLACLERTQRKICSWGWFPFARPQSKVCTCRCWEETESLWSTGNSGLPEPQKCQKIVRVGFTPNSGCIAMVLYQDYKAFSLDQVWPREQWTTVDQKRDGMGWTLWTI